jgi:hypothetical protein
VSFYAGLTTLHCPAAVAIHDDSDVLREPLGIDPDRPAVGFSVVGGGHFR